MPEADPENSHAGLRGQKLADECHELQDPGLVVVGVETWSCGLDQPWFADFWAINLAMGGSGGDVRLPVMSTASISSRSG